jgi:hypothetical protein
MSTTEQSTFVTRDEQRDFTDLKLMYEDDMDEQEAQFVLDMNDRIARWGLKTYISGKQRAWLEQLVKKYLDA